MSRNKILTDTIGVYDRKAFNSYGDAFIHWNLPKKKIISQSSIGEKFNEETITNLKNFKSYIESKQAKLFITYPCFQDSSFENSKEKIKMVDYNLRQNGFSVISFPERYKMDNSLMYNTVYHLTKKGVDIRTSLLIEDLKKVITK